MPMPCDRVWHSRRSSAPFRETVSFLDDRLVLGADTRLLGLDDEVSARITLNSDPAHDRLVALLAVAGRGHLAKAALSQLAVSLDDWRRGERALAAIRLAFAPLPRIRDHDEAYRLFLAETALDGGLRPHDLLKELGYEGCVALLKFDPGQPRVPAGSDRGGQWTSGDAGGGRAPSPSPKPAAIIEPAYGGEDGARVIPVLVRPEGGDAEEQKWRRLGFGESKDEQFEDGHLLVHPAPMFVVPPALVAPGTSIITGPKLAPAEGDPKPGGTTTSDDDGSACPKPENDRPNGPNFNGDEFEYAMSLLINPESPTPKNSAATPGVTSQAYYLPSPAKTGQTSFDDCKQRDTPTSLPIPGLRPGDMFELKAPGWGWQIFAINSAGDQQFASQVRNQNAAVVAEGRGRQIYYCVGNQAVANQAQTRFGGQNPNSHFLVCH